jgi:hypothetical protein
MIDTKAQTARRVQTHTGHSTDHAGLWLFFVLGHNFLF